MTAADWPPPEAVERAARAIWGKRPCPWENISEKGKDVLRRQGYAALLAAFPVDPRAEAWDEGKAMAWNRYRSEWTSRLNPYRADAIKEGRAEVRHTHDAKGTYAGCPACGTDWPEMHP